MKKKCSLFLSVLLCCGASLTVHAEHTQSKSNLSFYLEDLGDFKYPTCKEDPHDADGSPLVPIRAELYCTIRNLVATSQEDHDILYTEKLAACITALQDDQGKYSYDAVSGKENTLIGIRDHYCSQKIAIFQKAIVCTAFIFKCN